jgi:anti-sigma factor RsiW
MSRNQEMIALLDRYMDDELTDSERNSFEALVADEPELSRELAERRKLMGMLGDWADASETSPENTSRSGLLLGAAAAVAVAATALIASNLPLQSTTPAEHELRWRDMKNGVSVSSEGELTVDPFAAERMQWRKLNKTNGVEVIPGKPESSDELLVDPFPVIKEK